MTPSEEEIDNEVNLGLNRAGTGFYSGWGDYQSDSAYLGSSRSLSYSSDGDEDTSEDLKTEHAQSDVSQEDLS